MQKMSKYSCTRAGEAINWFCGKQKGFPRNFQKEDHVMAKASTQPAPEQAVKQETQGAIPLPKEGFTPSRTRSDGISAKMRDFFTMAWEQYQKANPDACITNIGLVKGLRLAWYDHLEANGYNRNTARVVAGDWYKIASRHVPYIRDQEVLKRRNKG